MIFYELLYGLQTKPFLKPGEKIPTPIKYFKYVDSRDLIFPPETYVSSLSQDLLNNMLEKNFEKRYS